MSILSSVLATGRRNRESDGVARRIPSRMLGTLGSRLKYRIGLVAKLAVLLAVPFVVAPSAFGQSVATGQTLYRPL